MSHRVGTWERAGADLSWTPRGVQANLARIAEAANRYETETLVAHAHRLTTGVSGADTLRAAGLAVGRRGGDRTEVLAGTVRRRGWEWCHSTPVLAGPT